MKTNQLWSIPYSSTFLPWYHTYYDHDSPPQGIDNNGNPVPLFDPPGENGVNGPKGQDSSKLQGTTATGYNRNSMQSIGTFDYKHYNTHWYNSIYRTVSVNNVSTFNKYIFEKIRKMNKDLDNELSGYFGDNVLLFSPNSNKKAEYINMYRQFLRSVGTQPVGTQHLPTVGNYLPVSRYFMDIDEKAWMKNSCELHLIGTPDDVEDLSMFPGLIVREVSDETPLFIKDAVSTSILHTQSQLIKYKLETYYDVVPRRAKSLEDPTTDIRLFDDDHPYCERADFQDPILLETISPSYEQQINPDERVYKIYIQMSDDLITTAYERSNFFIDIRNSNKKMSIKNFIKYLS